MELLVCTGLLGLLLKDMQLTTQAEALYLQGKLICLPHKQVLSCFGAESFSIFPAYPQQTFVCLVCSAHCQTVHSKMNI